MLPTIVGTLFLGSLFELEMRCLENDEHPFQVATNWWWRLFILSLVTVEIIIGCSTGRLFHYSLVM